jgi:thiol-disulfide isomerase/thioredoxin
MEIPSRENEDLFGTSKFVTELKPSDFDPVETWKLRNHKCSIVLFYAPWCPHCQHQVKMWNDLGEKAAFFDVCSFNCEKNSGHLMKIKEDRPDMVNGYPTFIIYKNGEPVERTGKSDDERNVQYLLKACMRSCK